MTAEYNRAGNRMISPGDHVKNVNTGATGTVIKRDAHKVLVRWNDKHETEYYVNDMAIEPVQ